MQTATSTTGSDALLTEAQAADFLALSIRTLQAWRVRGGGPRFVKVGRSVRYRHSALATWVDANTVSSTTEADARAAAHA